MASPPTWFLAWSVVDFLAIHTTKDIASTGTRQCRCEALLRPNFPLVLKNLSILPDTIKKKILWRLSRYFAGKLWPLDISLQSPWEKAFQAKQGLAMGME
jgi:hypothetical protein